MWWQFFAQNAHFGINLFAALVCMGICWLYVDAWSNRHAPKELFKWLGFGALGLSFLFQATAIEQSVLGEALFGHVTVAVVILTRLIGYASIIIGQIIDPLQTVPKNKGLELDDKLGTHPTQAATDTKNISVNATEKARTSRAPGLLALSGLTGKWLSPVGGVAIAVLYWRRATVGLERHLKAVAYAFLLFGLSDLVGLTSLLRGTSNPSLYTWVAAFGWIWWLQQVLLLTAVIVIGRWVWSYLLERFFSQLFMIFTGIIVIVFLVVSVSFTGLLLRNIRSDSLNNLNTAANVLGYALGSRQSATFAAAQQLAGSSDILNAVSRPDRDVLKKLTTGFLKDKQLSGLTITNQSGQVLLRGEDTDEWGDSISNDTLVKRALLGLNQSSIGVTQGVNAPIVQVRSAVAITDSAKNIVGSIITTLHLDSAFVDGIKKSTGLQSSIYGADVLAATTLTAPNGAARPVGVKLSDTKIKQMVLQNGHSYSGPVSLQNRQMLATFVPIKDVDNAPVGMLLVVEPQSAILLTAGHSVELTFLLTALLLLISIWPIYLLVKSLTKQLS